MQDWTRAQVRQVIRDKRAPLNKVHAARQMLQAASAKTTKVGQPIAGEALDRICDRTVGKPKQSMESRHTEESVHVQVNVDLAQCLRHFEAFGKPQLPHVEPDKPSEG